MPRETAYMRGMRLLTEHRLTITEVTDERIRATARGSGEVHRLGLDGSTWWCSCPVRTDQCSHLHALRAVTVVPRGTLDH